MRGSHARLTRAAASSDIGRDLDHPDGGARFGCRVEDALEHEEGCSVESLRSMCCQPFCCARVVRKGATCVWGPQTSGGKLGTSNKTIRNVNATVNPV